MLTKSTTMAGIALLALAFATPATALTLTGLTVQVANFFPFVGASIFPPTDFVVGTTTPVSFFGVANASVGASAFTVDIKCTNGCGFSSPPTINGRPGFNGYALLDTYGTAADFTSATINTSTNFAGFDSSRLTFDANSVLINVAGLTGNGVIVIDLNSSAGAIPEPASWTMLVAGFGLVGGAVRRRKRLQTA